MEVCRAAGVWKISPCWPAIFIRNAAAAVKYFLMPCAMIAGFTTIPGREIVKLKRRGGTGQVLNEPGRHFQRDRRYDWRYADPAGAVTASAREVEKR